MGAKKSKDTGNPFTGLDIKQFPTEREQRAAKRRVPQPQASRQPIQEQHIQLGVLLLSTRSFPSRW